MILSEFAGAAQSLNGSIVVNPWNTEELADALHDAVTMSDEQRALNYEKMARYVNKYTSAWWGESFVAELTKISELAEKKLKTRRESTLASAASNAEERNDSIVVPEQSQRLSTGSGQQQKSAAVFHDDNVAVDDYSTEEDEEEEVGMVMKKSFSARPSQASTPRAID
ncbi:Trehalose-6-P synthase/phosphatase complex synthase subunit [Teratosphaeriaceae sp. CCFEE 6253]|nr:Trehalose-6-P synthase/phosphatase complex synthase subunit [Teratosphaeriaceae sp. CCFEE 6253]